MKWTITLADNTTIEANWDEITFDEQGLNVVGYPFFLFNDWVESITPSL